MQPSSLSKAAIGFWCQLYRSSLAIRKALDANDFDQAHSLVHNLKRLAGNLEATDLQAAVVEMETLVKGQKVKSNPNNELSQKFAEPENALEKSLDSVKTIGPTAEKKTIASIIRCCGSFL